jgi:hypothetical protein
LLEAKAPPIESRTVGPPRCGRPESRDGQKPGSKLSAPHLAANDLAALATTGGRPAGPPPLPPAEPGTVLGIDRAVSRSGIVCLGNYQLLAAEILAGSRVSIRIEDTTLEAALPRGRRIAVGRREEQPQRAHRALGNPPRGARQRGSWHTQRGEFTVGRVVGRCGAQ